jgi:hypothetical protein
MKQATPYGSLFHFTDARRYRISLPSTPMAPADRPCLLRRAPKARTGTGSGNGGNSPV